MKYGRVTSAPWHSRKLCQQPSGGASDLRPLPRLYSASGGAGTARIPDKQKFVADAKKKILEANEEWDEVVFRRDHAKELAAAVKHIQLPKLRMVCDPDELATTAAEKNRHQMAGPGF